MLEYVKEMMHREELNKRTGDCDILNIEDGYLSIPQISGDVVFTCIAGIVGVWNIHAFERLEQEVAALPNIQERGVLTRALLSKAYYAECTEKGYEFGEWFRNASGGKGSRLYLIPTGHNDCYCYLVDTEKEFSAG